jgi:HlyD family type I secretion membrane fusion protein
MPQPTPDSAAPAPAESAAQPATPTETLPPLTPLPVLDPLDNIVDMNDDNDMPCMGLRKPPFPPKLILWGLLLVAVFIGASVLWTLSAPIKSAVISPGIVSVAGYRKQVQHLEGGIVDRILVHDSERVQQGQLLIKLRDVRPAAELRQLDRRHNEVLATIARLQAERDEREQVEYPDELQMLTADQAVADLLTGQNNIFSTRRNLNRDKRSVLEHKITQKEQEINGLNGQNKAKKQERKLLEEEIGTVEESLKKNLVPKAEELRLRQRLAQIDGDLSEFQATIERLQQNILEIRLQISESHAARLSDITEELRGQQALLYELSQKMLSAEDVLRRTEILSPIDGVVVNLQVHTADGVIAAGQPLLEVVPTNGDLVVHAYIDPEDIEEVRPGMDTDVRLTSFSRRERIPLRGRVGDISADRITDQYSKNQFYRARIDLDYSSAPVVSAHMVAGMGADVFIPTGSRTPLDYLLAPITRSLQYGFKEK